MVLLLPPVARLHPRLPPSEPGKLHSDYKMHPHFPPQIWGGGVHLIVCKIRYLVFLLKKQIKLSSFYIWLVIGTLIWDVTGASEILYRRDLEKIGELQLKKVPLVLCLYHR